MEQAKLLGKSKTSSPSSSVEMLAVSEAGPDKVDVRPQQPTHNDGDSDAGSERRAGPVQPSPVHPTDGETEA